MGLKWIVYIFFVCFFIGIAADTLLTEQQAYDFCMRNEQTFIAIVWPLAA